MKNEEKVDWRGEKLPNNESPESIINCWVIEPSRNKEFDEIWIRSYFDAMDYTSDLIQDLMDSTGEEDLLESGVTVNVKLKKVKLRDYLDVQDEEVF